MAIKDDVKLALRIVTTAYDSQIDGLIDAAELDLEESGVIVAPDNLSALHTQAIIAYCRAHFNNDKNREDFEKVYNAIASKLHMTTDYREEAET